MDVIIFLLFPNQDNILELTRADRTHQKLFIGIASAFKTYQERSPIVYKSEIRNLIQKM